MSLDRPLCLRAILSYLPRFFGPVSGEYYNLPLPQPQGKEAIGWLYCAEGSNVGAAFLYKDAQTKLGLDADRGAGHLAPHADGRGKHWREFVEQLNTLGIEGEDRQAALKGALDAFAFYKVLLREIFELPAATTA